MQPRSRSLLPSGRDVLVVEDELRIRSMLDHALREMGFAATLVSTAEAASRAMAQQRFDVLILDLNLPGKGGIEFLEDVRKRDKNVQAIILTGFGDLDAARKAIHLDVVEFMTKPCALGELEIAMGRALERRKEKVVGATSGAPPVLQFDAPPKPKPVAPALPLTLAGSPDDGSTPSMEEIERRHILSVVEKCNGNRAAAAAELGISLRKLYYRLGQYQKHAFTLVELLVVIGIIAVLLSIMIPTLAGAREQANRAQCSNNLRQLVLAMMMYANADHGHAYPRTRYDPNQHLQLDNAGYNVPNTFGNSGYVGENNVPASLFHLFRTQVLPAQVLICPSAPGEVTPGFVSVDRETTSNWERYTDNVSYSLAAPFPTAAAAKAGFVWKNNLPTDFAIAADINPGTRGGTAPPNNVVGPSHLATTAQMAAANSNNHRNKGQNVVYGDGHVQFQLTPYCGGIRAATPIPDNIYTAGPGDFGATGDTALPTDAKDSVLFPTDDPGGR